MVQKETEDNSVKVLYDLYISNLDTICRGIKFGAKPLIQSVVPHDFSYDPKKFINVVRTKFKNGVWESGDEYNSNMLYKGFNNICDEKLNILH
jgi:hypothetical protein